MLPAVKTDARPRKRIGKYLITGRIGRGGMGQVYKGYDENLEREVAIKTLVTDALVDEDSRKRFQIEARAAAKLQHPNIVTVYELGEDRGLQYIAMELLPGIDLEALLRSGERLLVQEKLDVLAQVCRGLAYAHDRGIVHRDIKPANVRLLEDGTAKIMDFGIAKLGSTGVTRAGMMVGTVQYMSPEQIRGKTLDGRSDLFSVGVILYEMLAGKRPFGGGNATEILFKIVNEPAPPLPAQGALTPHLQALVDRLLAKEPSERAPNAAAVADDISRLLGQIGAAAAHPEALEAVSASRRLLREGKVEECLARLQDTARRHPESVDARRALRAATREMHRRQQQDRPAADDDFPELGGHDEGATRRSPETAMQPTVASPQATGALPTNARPGSTLQQPAPSSGPPLLLLAAGGVGLAVLAAAGVFVLHLMRAPAPAPPGPSTPNPPATLSSGPGRDTPPVTQPPAPARVKVQVTTEPAGATLAVDGVEAATTSPAEIEVDPAAAHRIRASLDGYSAREEALEPGKTPSQLRLTLEPLGPPGKLLVRSGYPVDVVWKGKVLAKGQVSPKVSLPQGRQTVSVVSSAHGLKTTFNVEVKGGAEAFVEVAGLGKLNIRANPDNCEVFLDGVFVDYPPILDRPVAAGMHTVSFKWPDGTRREQPVEVRGGSPAYVVGRKD